MALEKRKAEGGEKDARRESVNLKYTSHLLVLATPLVCECTTEPVTHSQCDARPMVTFHRQSIAAGTKCTA